MQKRTQVILTFMFVIVLVTGLYIFTDWFSQVTGYFAGEDERTKLAQCLDDLEVEFYGATYCADCEKQKDEFGRAFKRIRYIDCKEDLSLCPNIQSIPAWYINKDIHYGFKSITELQEISGCADK